ncbi:MAG: calcium/sodium antiporter [Anaerolineales bacterium]|nr:calcium/sodium antiporter [Anaerolineales bacterium]
MVAITSLLVIVICIFLLAIVTDEFFITSLDQISQRFKLSSDVAGASLMAMGSSAPELAIALLALFKGGGEHSDLGIGTIVGSAVFNILIITGVSAIARPAKITWRVVVRDVVMYSLSLALLFLTFSDGVIQLWEALSFLALYAVYLLILANWKAFHNGATEDVIHTMEAELEAEHHKTGGFHTIMRGITAAIGFLMGDPKENYIRAFNVSVLLIGLISWFLVEYAIVFSEAVNIPPVIVALTILAGGTSIPDMIASIVVARQGRGEMAIANAVGSNIFDILIGLGLPWIIAIIALGETVIVGTGDLWSSAIILLGTVVLLFIFLTTKYTLSRLEGWILVSCYGAYVLWAWFGG